MAEKGKIKFWKPGTEAPPQLSYIKEERQDLSESTSFIYNRNLSLSIQQQRERLPIFKYRTHILYLLERYKTLVIVGETGSGKTTQIPQYLLEAGWAATSPSTRRVIGVTQPRRVAAITSATRVAEESGDEAVGVGMVGYAVRFDDCTNARTKVKFLTDGLMIREMMSDPLLKQYSVIMVDEAHERSANTDILLGLLRKIQKKRPELRLIIASATLDVDEMIEFFHDESDNEAVVALSVEGRMFPVDIYYTERPVADYIRTSVETALAIHRAETRQGDILVFLTGQEEVENCVRTLKQESHTHSDKYMKLLVLPMYSNLPYSDQLKVFQRTPRNMRKIIVATNIAETSITIDNIVYVIDCGFVRIKALDPRVGVDSLVITEVSKATAIQRAGRAGRVRAGHAYRLYSDEAYKGLEDCSVPELRRMEMSSVLLRLKALGIDNILRFKFVSPPPAENVVKGLEILFALGVIDESCHLTKPLGFSMAELPLDPMWAKVFICSEEFECSEEIITIVAMAQIQNVFQSPPQQKAAAIRAHRKFSVAEGDHVTNINVFESYLQANRSSHWCKEHFLNHRGLKRAAELREQLVRIAKSTHVKLVSCEGDVKKIQRCLTAGFFPNAAIYDSIFACYKTVREGHSLHIHPTSVLYTELPLKCVLFSEVVQGKEKIDFMRDITVIDEKWLFELAPHYYEFGTARELSEKRAKLDT